MMEAPITHNSTTQILLYLNTHTHSHLREITQLRLLSHPYKLRMRVHFEGNKKTRTQSYRSIEAYV